MTAAPRPGSSHALPTVERVERERAQQQILTLRLRGETYKIAIANLPLGDRLAVRKATGLPFESFFGDDKLGVDSLIVLWWVARRRAGEADLTLDAASAAWPEDLTADEIDVSIGAPDDDESADDHPES